MIKAKSTKRIHNTDWNMLKCVHANLSYHFQWMWWGTGIVFLRGTSAGLAFADAWYHNLVEAPGRYAPLTSDQQVLSRFKT